MLMSCIHKSMRGVVSLGVYVRRTLSVPSILFCLISLSQGPSLNVGLIESATAANPSPHLSLRPGAGRIGVSAVLRT